LPCFVSFIDCKIQKTKQLVSGILISSSFFLDFVANIVYQVKYELFKNYDLITYPGSQDYLWIMSYLLFGLGVMMYSYLVKRLINKNKAKRDAYLIACASIAALILSYPLLNFFEALDDYIFDPLYFAAPFFASISCIPIYFLFKGGKISAAWRDFTLGGFGYMIGELLFLLNISIEGVYASDLLYTIAYIFFIKAFYDLFIHEKIKR